MNILLISLCLFGFNGVKADVLDSFRNDKYGEYDIVYGAINDRDIEDDKFRPCVMNDWQCMRKFLAANSDCRPAYGPVPDPIKLPVDKFYIPVVNLTITHTNLEIRGFGSAKITEFYVNKATGNLVISVNVQRLNQTSPKTYFTYLRAGKEPIIRSDFTTVTYDSATFMAVIPKVPHLRLDRSEMHADIHDSRPMYAIGPKIGNSTDPDVIASFLAFNTNIPTVIQEAFVFQSSLLTSIYIQNYLCDFGFDSYNNYLSFLRTKGYTQVPGRGYEFNNLV